jgi:hypothetical protein
MGSKGALLDQILCDLVSVMTLDSSFFTITSFARVNYNGWIVEPFLTFLSKKGLELIASETHLLSITLFRFLF